MYCPKCGTQNLEDAKFCKECGYDFSSRVVTPVEQKDKIVVSSNLDVDPKIVKGTLAVFGVAFIIPILFMALIIVIIAGVLIMFFSQGHKKTIEFNDMKVPTVYKVTGSYRSVCSFGGRKESEYREVNMGYCDEYNVEDINEYINYLITEEEFVQDSPGAGNVYKIEDKYTIEVVATTKHVQYTFRIKDDVNEEGE